MAAGWVSAKSLNTSRDVTAQIASITWYDYSLFYFLFLLTIKQYNILNYSIDVIRNLFSPDLFFISSESLLQQVASGRSLRWLSAPVPGVPIRRDELHLPLLPFALLNWWIDLLLLTAPRVDFIVFQIKHHHSSTLVYAETQCLSIAYNLYMYNIKRQDDYQKWGKLQCCSKNTMLFNETFCGVGIVS